MKDNQHVIWLGSSLILCIVGFIVLTALGRAPVDSALTNLAFALVGGIAGVSVPRTTGAAGTVITDPKDSTINTGTPATDAGKDTGT